MLRAFLFLLMFTLLPCGAAQAQDYQKLTGIAARVCPANVDSAKMPDFSADSCRDARLYAVDPQGREIWVDVRFTPIEAFRSAEEPLGLVVSAKASSEVFLNGVSLGSNGVPGPTSVAEVPGAMDTVFFIPAGTLRDGENRLVMRMSSMHGAIDLASPVHNVLLVPYGNPRQPGAGFWLALVTFGLFMAGCVYFGVSAWKGHDREASAIIAVASLATALQLASEAARDIIAYPYPMHDLRLTLILGFAAISGLAVLAYVLQLLFKAHVKARVCVIAVVGCVMLAIALVLPGFDFKTILVLAAAAVATALSGIVAALKGSRMGIWIAAAGAAFTLLILWQGGRFLDQYFYFLMAGLIMWLLLRQASGKGAPAHAELPQPPPTELQRIELSNGGKVEFVEAADVVRFSGAGDYVEVLLTSGRSSLYNGSLAALERTLPAGFIRVHRSHIVNAALVTALEREPAGTGILNMTGGSEVPVSRRNMANVRGALIAQ